jgi:hypothetical protein
MWFFKEPTLSDIFAALRLTMENHFDIQKTATDLARVSHLEESAPDIEQAAHQTPDDSERLKHNAIFYHQETTKTPEEVRAERHFVRKMDFLIMPLIGTLYFLASLVRVHKFNFNKESLMIIGPGRYGKRGSSRNDRRYRNLVADVQQLC